MNPPNDQSSTQPMAVYPVSMNDHDLLIRLDQKMSQLSVDFRDIRDGLSNRVSALETKITTYDQRIAEYPADKLVTMLMAHERWINNYKNTYKMIVGFAVAGASVITFVLTVLLQSLNIVHIVK